MTHNLPPIILLAEADPSTREITTIILEMAGYGVLSASDGSVALDILLMHGNIQVLVSNTVMPGGIGGVELASRGVALFPSLRVVLTSDETVALDDDFPRTVGFLLKPYDRKALLFAIQAVTRN